jgi:hypothetical protein
MMRKLLAIKPINFKSCILGVSAALALTLVTVPLAFAEFAVRKVEIQNVEDRLLVSADVDLGLTKEVEDAVNNGVPLVLLTEFRIIRNGLLWDADIDQIKTRSRLRYHALSDHYIVETSTAEGIEMFRSVDDALKRIGTLRNIALSLPKSRAKSRHQLAVRSRLDIDALPGPLRPMAFLSSNWRLNSDWTHWKILP